MSVDISIDELALMELRRARCKAANGKSGSALTMRMDVELVTSTIEARRAVGGKTLTTLNVLNKGKRLFTGTSTGLSVAGMRANLGRSSWPSGSSCCPLCSSHAITVDHKDPRLPAEAQACRARGDSFVAERDLVSSNTRAARGRAPLGPPTVALHATAAYGARGTGPRRAHAPLYGSPRAGQPPTLTAIAFMLPLRPLLRTGHLPRPLLLQTIWPPPS